MLRFGNFRTVLQHSIFSDVGLKRKSIGRGEEWPPLFGGSGWNNYWSGHKETIRGTTPVNPCGRFNSLFYCIDFFFRREKYYKLFLQYTKHAFADIKTSTPWKRAQEHFYKSTSQQQSCCITLRSNKKLKQNNQAEPIQLNEYLQFQNSAQFKFERLFMDEGSECCILAVL